MLPIMKVNKENLTIILDEILEYETRGGSENFLRTSQGFCSAKLPSATQRWAQFYSHSASFSSPRDCKPELQMMYAGSKLSRQSDGTAERVRDPGAGRVDGGVATFKLVH